jgi:phage-related protein
MPSAGSITLDAKLNTNSLKNQVTKLGKSIGAINLKFNIANQNKVLKTQAQIKAQAKSTLTLEQAINNTIKSQTNNMNKLRAAAEKRLAKDKQLYDNAAKINQIYQNNAASNVSGNAQIAQIKQMQSLQSTVNTVSNSTNNLTKGLNVASQITNSLASGSNSLIQGFSSIASTIGGIIGTIASGGNAAIGGIVSTVISVLGNVAKIVANIVTGIVNTVIKIIKGGIGIIKNMFNFFKDLPDYISKAISKLGEMSLTFKALSGVINYCKSLAQQFMSIIGQKFNAYSIMNFVEDSFEMGSSITEQSHILKTIIPEFMEYQDALGGTSEYLLYMNEVTSKLGISQVNATKYLAGYAAMWESMGDHNSTDIKNMSKDMLQLTSDIASFKDMSYEDVSKSLKSVIFGGQTRTGLNLGVDIYAESMKKYANSIGKVWENMSAAEKSALRLQKVMSDLSFMSGDFSNTSYTWANQVRFLKEQFTNLKAVIGENLIMVFNWLLTVINKVMAALNACAVALNSFLKSLGLGWILQSSGNNTSKAIGEETDALNDAAESVGGAGSSAAKAI